MANDRKLVLELNQIESAIDVLRLEQNRILAGEINGIAAKHGVSAGRVKISIEFDPMSEQKYAVATGSSIEGAALTEINDLLDDHGYYLAAANTGTAVFIVGDTEIAFRS